MLYVSSQKAEKGCKEVKKRRCKCCKEYFPMDEMIKPRGTWFKDFSHMAKHGQVLAAKKKQKDSDNKHKALKKKVKDNDKSFQTKKTQQIFNTYIRLRDLPLPCISCGRYHTGQYHAGHYRSVGANPELRFIPTNCHKQCSACNNHLSGNISNYRINLLCKIGETAVADLEGNSPAKRYTVYNLKTIQNWYKRKTKRLEKELTNEQT
jgi:hypothetical protein